MDVSDRKFICLIGIFMNDQLKYITDDLNFFCEKLNLGLIMYMFLFHVFVLPFSFIHLIIKLQ